jgi:transcriptional regulator with XRE-family HTH domain
MSAVNTSLLGDFIRVHRERISPAQVGLPPGLRRRAKGLRREEVASLCGISPTWLTWIEQGRTQGVSAGTLARIAAVLMLTQAEREYLFDLAGLRDQDEPAQPGGMALQETLSMAVSQIQSPAYVLDLAWDVLAWNRPAAELFAGWLVQDDAAAPNLLRYMFLDAGARALVADWPKRAQRLVAEFRADANANLEQPGISAFVDDLRRKNKEFDMLWRQQDVLEREGGDRAFNHPARGSVVYRQLTLRVAHSPDLKLVMLL